MRRSSVGYACQAVWDRTRYNENCKANPESFDEWKQTELVQFLERSGPPVLPARVEVVVIGCNGVMKIGDGSNVPRVTCHGARKEAARVVNEVGDNHFYEHLWELGGRG